jgi:DNA polymerase III subunit gamma/tau
MSTNGEQGAHHTALYRKYRPRSLDGLVSQSQVTNVLGRSLKQGKIAHAYLLTGPKGVGKTSIARIMAHAINDLPYTGDETHLDIIEIDAASNNGVDDVRDLRDKVNLAPTSASKKIYIIDEVHMLSKPAFNALLKTLEEPPSHVVFILATTDLHKVPATIISRTQHFALHSISQSDLAAHLKEIAKGESIQITDEALDAIAARGDGSFRNSISLLDQLSSFADEDSGITLELVESTLGLARTQAIDSLLDAVNNGDIAAIINQLDTLENEGIQSIVLADQLITAVRARLGKQPHLVGLLDALLDVPQSSQPNLKILTVLVSHSKPKTAVAQTVKTPVAIIEEPIRIIEAKPSTKSQDTTASVSVETTPVVSEAIISTASQPAGKKRTGSAELDWNRLIEYTKENLVALHSVLSKCTHVLEGDQLTLYTGRKFNKTKLDEVRYQSQLNEALAHIGVGELYIITVPTAQPPADEKLAQIAAMMGGGHEINLDEAGEPA